ncbi:MAG: iron-containing alcohol dehydrogenase [Candidatus Latescibacteria bacterium]|nr:iron-containing alcohol dehydrogenase [Candidatus Latescibacterota bacterium]
MSYQQIFEYFSPTRLISGRGAIAKIPDVIRDQGLRRGLVVTDPGLVAAGIAGRALDVLREADVPCTVYDRVEANPPFANVDEAYGIYVKERCDYLIGLGGGSSMDVAKCVGVAAAHGGGWRDLVGIGKCRNRIPFLLCVPTTYGTGSEVTPFAVVTDLETRFKASIGSPLILPHAGVLDADLSVGLPLPIAGATGMDALTHAIESYVALTASPISEGLALHAIRLIGENLRQAAASDHNHEATERMLIASTVAGMAFSQTRLGNVHAMSHPVGGHFGVPHGVANAIILTRVMAYNLMASPQKFAEVARALGEPVEGLTTMEAAEASVEAVYRLGQDVGIPDGLAGVGVKQEAIPTLAEDAMKSGNVLINPRKTGLRDIIRLYEESM